MLENHKKENISKWLQKEQLCALSFFVIKADS